MSTSSTRPVSPVTRPATDRRPRARLVHVDIPTRRAGNVSSPSSNHCVGLSVWPVCLSRVAAQAAHPRHCTQAIPPARDANALSVASAKSEAACKVVSSRPGHSQPRGAPISGGRVRHQFYEVWLAVTWTSPLPISLAPGTKWPRYGKFDRRIPAHFLSDRLPAWLMAVADCLGPNKGSKPSRTAQLTLRPALAWRLGLLC